MPITLNKIKPKEEASPLSKLIGTKEPDSEAVLAIKAAIDSLADRVESYEAAKQLVKKFDAERTEIADACLMVFDDKPADEAITVETAKATLTLGEVGTSRSVKDLKGIRAILGEETFMSLIKINLGDIDKYLTLPQKEQVLEELPGKRSVKFELNKSDDLGLKKAIKTKKKA